MSTQIEINKELVSYLQTFGYRYDSIINFEILETGPHTVVMSPPVLENKTDGFGDKTGRQGDYRLSVQEAPE